MQRTKLVQIKEEFPCTHYFVYKNKEYQINFEFFKCYSNFFLNNQQELQLQKCIPLLDKKSEKSVNLSEESIQDFINFVHRKQIMLTDENVIPLNYLAKIYEIPLLLDVTKEFISTNQNYLALQILSLHQNDTQFQAEELEEIISDKFLDYIDDRRLLTLKIPILNRILTKFLYVRKSQLKEDENDKVMIFLFKCLDCFGRDASILFSNINFENERSKYLNHLMTNYAHKFDFHFINLTFMKTMFQIQSDLLLKEEQSRLHHEEWMREIEKKMKKIELVNDQKLNEQKKIFDGEINKLKKENDDMKLQIQNLVEQKQKSNEEIEKLRRELNNTKSELVNKIKEERKEVLCNNCAIFEYLNSSTNENIIDSGVINCETSINEGTPIKNLFDYSKDTHFRLQDVEGGYIILDFKTKRVSLTKYYFAVPSRNNGNYVGRPKSWRIEGSNDKNSWDLIDRRVNDTSLNDWGRSNEFLCKMNKNVFYKFIRIIEEISHHNNHNFILAEIEFYGSIQNI